MTYSLDDINRMTQAEFVAALGAIFEHTPEIAAQAWHQRPFASVETLHQSMVQIASAFELEQKLALIRAHPDLASKAKMADASVREQASVGLDALTLEEYDRFSALNQAYQEKFQFPFIIAVRNHTRASILAAFEERSRHTPEVELERAMQEIATIARFRLLDTVG